MSDIYIYEMPNPLNQSFSQFSGNFAVYNNILVSIGKFFSFYFLYVIQI